MEKDPDRLTYLYSKNPDMFYLVLSDFSGEEIARLCEVNKRLNDLLCLGKGRNIWKELWKRNLSKHVPGKDFQELRKEYLKIAAKIKIREKNYEKLRFAAKHGFEVLYFQILKLPDTPNPQSFHYSEIFNDALDSQNAEIIRHLTQSSLFKNIGHDYLTWIIQHGKPEILRIFIEGGINPNPINRFPPLSEAAKSKRKEMVKILLENGAKVGLKHDSDYYTALDEAVRIPDIEMVKLLIENGAQIKGDYSALSTAAYSGALDVLKFLVGAGGDIHESPKHGNPGEDEWILKNAISAGEKNRKVIEYLLDLGAIPTPEIMWDAVRQLPSYIFRLLLESPNLTDKAIESAISAASYYGKTEILLEIHESHPEILKKDKDAIWNAVKEGNLGTVKYLLSLKLHINMRALVSAIRERYFEIAKALLNAGVDPNVEHGKPLELAVEKGSPEMIRLLLEHGADPKYLKQSERMRYKNFIKKNYKPQESESESEDEDD